MLKARRALLRRIGLLLLLCLPVSILAQPADEHFDVLNVWFDKQKNGYAVRADLQVGHRETIEKILHSGYTLQLSFEMRFMQRRSWLFDRLIGNIDWQGQLSYEALPRVYILKSGGGKTQRFSSLAAAAAEINQLRAGANNDSEYIKILLREDVYIRARFYPETTILPTAMQVGLLLDDDWGGTSKWREFILDVRE